jgi:hypothetical protein
MRKDELITNSGRSSNPKTSAFDHLLNNRVPLSTTIRSTVSKKNQLYVDTVVVVVFRVNTA